MTIPPFDERPVQDQIAIIVTHALFNAALVGVGVVEKGFIDSNEELNTYLSDLKAIRSQYFLFTGFSLVGSLVFDTIGYAIYRGAKSYGGLPAHLVGASDIETVSRYRLLSIYLAQSAVTSGALGGFILSSLGLLSSPYQDTFACATYGAITGLAIIGLGWCCYEYFKNTSSRDNSGGIGV